MDARLISSLCWVHARLISSLCWVERNWWMLVLADSVGDLPPRLWESYRGADKALVSDNGCANGCNMPIRRPRGFHTPSSIIIRLEHRGRWLPRIGNDIHPLLPSDRQPGTAVITSSQWQSHFMFPIAAFGVVPGSRKHRRPPMVTHDSSVYSSVSQGARTADISFRTTLGVEGRVMAALGG